MPLYKFKSPVFCCVAFSLTLAGSELVTSVQADDPLEPLKRRVGTWVNKTHLKKAEWTPEPRTTTGQEKIKWVLDNNFIQGEVTNADGTTGLWLMNYDAEEKVYRSWFFGSQNVFPKSETIGRWDPKAEKMKWKSDLGNGLRAEMIFQYSGQDKLEWSYIIRNEDGKLMMESGGTQTRKK